MWLPLKVNDAIPPFVTTTPMAGCDATRMVAPSFTLEGGCEGLKGLAGPQVLSVGDDPVSKTWCGGFVFVQGWVQGDVGAPADEGEQLAHGWGGDICG